MNKLINNWILNTYQFGWKEIRSLRSKRTEIDDKKKKLRVYQLIYANIIMLIMHSIVVLMSVIYIGLSFFYHPLSCLGLIITLPTIKLIKYFQQKALDKN